jgi:hypothetical protein
MKPRASWSTFNSSASTAASPRWAARHIELGPSNERGHDSLAIMQHPERILPTNEHGDWPRSPEPERAWCSPTLERTACVCQVGGFVCRGPKRLPDIRPATTRLGGSGPSRGSPEKMVDRHRDGQEKHQATRSGAWPPPTGRQKSHCQEHVNDTVGPVEVHAMQDVRCGSHKGDDPESSALG